MSRAIVSVGAAVCASLLISGIVLAQQAQAPESRLRGPQVVPLTAETIYRGWRASHVLGDRAATKSNDELGAVRKY